MNVKLKTLILVALVGILCVSACKQGDQSGKAPKENTEDRDLQVQYAEWAKAPDAEEARRWFSKPEAKFWNESSLNIPELVEQLYGMGAQKVVVIGISKEQDVELAAAILVELPTNPIERAKLFEQDKKMAELNGEPPLKDTGQQYLHYAFD